MFASILIALMIVAGNLVAAATAASGLLIASGVIAETSRTDRLAGIGMMILGIIIFTMGFLLMA